MSLDISLLQRAIERLDEGWHRYQQDTSDTQILDGLIQRCEFTYEMSLKPCDIILNKPLIVGLSSR